MSLILSQLLVAILTTITTFVAASRGNDLMVSDISGFRTALNVIGNYQLHLNTTLIYGYLLLLIEFVWLSHLRLSLQPHPVRNRLLGMVGFLCALLVLLQCQSKVEVSYFLAGGRYYNGFILNFVLTGKDVFIQAPQDYSPERITQLAKSYSTEDTMNREGERTPNVIVVMNESFSDLGICGNLNTNITATPFFNSLRENTIRGYALSSIYGGGTPNSEYEFLTGNSLAFLPHGASVYETYLKQPTYSLVSELKGLDYTCISMHPYLSSGWN